MKIPYTLTRSKRKSIVIYVRGDGVEVRAPLKCPQTHINEFVASKQKWIEKSLTKQQERQEKIAAFSLNYGDTALMFGKSYSITARAGNRAGFDGEVFYMPENLSSHEIINIMVQIYRMLAKRRFTEKVSHFAKITGVSPIAVKINGAKTRWGSCSSKGNVNFSLRLVMAGEDVIDYVIVHELAHLLEMNHSASFWRIVQNTLPDYKKRQAKLKELQKRLSTEDWE